MRTLVVARRAERGHVRRVHVTRLETVWILSRKRASVRPNTDRLSKAMRVAPTWCGGIGVSAGGGGGDTRACGGGGGQRRGGEEGSAETRVRARERAGWCRRNELRRARGGRGAGPKPVVASETGVCALEKRVFALATGVFTSRRKRTHGRVCCGGRGCVPERETRVSRERQWVARSARAAAGLPRRCRRRTRGLTARGYKTTE